MEDAKFPGQSCAALFDVSVDAPAISFQPSMLLLGCKRERSHGRMVNTRKPHKVIEIDAALAAKLAGQLLPRDREVAKDLCQAAGEKAPAHIHLPKSFLSVQVALSEE